MASLVPPPLNILDGENAKPIRARTYVRGRRRGSFQLSLRQVRSKYSVRVRKKGEACSNAFKFGIMRQRVQ